MRVSVHHFSPESGGRRLPIFAGYRPICVFTRSADSSGLIAEFDPNGLEIAPGATGEGELRPMSPEIWPRLQQGDIFWLRDGHLVAEVTVLAPGERPQVSP